MVRAALVPMLACLASAVYQCEVAEEVDVPIFCSTALYPSQHDAILRRKRTENV